MLFSHILTITEPGSELLARLQKPLLTSVGRVHLTLKDKHTHKHTHTLKVPSYQRAAGTFSVAETSVLRLAALSGRPTASFMHMELTQGRCGTKHLFSYDKAHALSSHPAARTTYHLSCLHCSSRHLHHANG